MSLGSLVDVPGILVGSREDVGDGAATGVTVVVPPDGSTVAVDVRGGGPATHETDVLAPGTATRTAHAIVLTGGSALGLGSVAGVASALVAAGRGVEVPDTGIVVPIVPAAAVFDLGRGGDASRYPGPELGAAALQAAGTTVRRGSVGAGTGALMDARLLKGGIGTASVRTADGYVVSALAVANAVGSPCDADGRLLASGFPTLGPDLPAPSPEESRRWRARGADRPAERARPGRNTVIGVVATDAGLGSGDAARLASSAHAGLARAVHPSHTLADGDTVFAVATGPAPVEDPLTLLDLGIAAADAFMLAIVDAALSAKAVAGLAPGYSELVPSVAARLGY